MSGQTAALQINARKVHAFLYPDAPWEPEAVSSGNLFRELSPEEISQPDQTADAGSGILRAADIGIPVRYEYRVEPGFELDAEDRGETTEEPVAAPDGVGRDGMGAPAAEGESDRYFRELLAAECAKAEDRGRGEGLELGREQGREEGRVEAIRHLHAGVESERNRLAEQTASLLQGFAEARDGYVHRLEQESVRLALAIAARILRREAQTDPLLLTGAVRVALGQLSATTAVRLRVPAADQALWTESLAHIPNLPIRPEVVGDARLELGECRIETELGSANLSLDAQLEVLERGFFEQDRTLTEILSNEDGNPEGPAHAD